MSQPMDPYDVALAPAPFGLNNTGVICYFNSFLQLLASCTAFTRQVILNAEYIGATRTGAALLEFCSAYAEIDPTGRAVARAQPAAGIALLSLRVLSEFVADLAAYRPHFRLGGGQECASEVIDCIFEMLQTADAGLTKIGDIRLEKNPVACALSHRYRHEVHCASCKGCKIIPVDDAIVFRLFHYDALKVQPSTPDGFARALRVIVVPGDSDYKCERCEARVRSVHRYILEVVPEVVLCMFNLFDERGARRARYLPERFSLPGADGSRLAFRLVAQVEHAGRTTGGHYWANCVRAGDSSFKLNDIGVSPWPLVSTPDTYIVAYHLVGREAAQN